MHEARGADRRSPFALFLFCITTAANQVPQLRQRIRVESGGDVVVEHAHIGPAYVVQAGDDLFNFATVPFPQKLDDFCQTTRVASEKMRDNDVLAPFDGVRDDVLYCTCLPWIDFTHISHPIDSRIADSVPRVAWGRFGDDNTVAVNLQAHHALVDGRHIAAFFQALTQALQELPSSS